MPNTFKRQLAVSPEDLIAKIAGEAVSLDDLISNKDSPIAGYGEFLKESFTGDRNVAVKLNGNNFLLTTIGLPPLKKGSMMSNVGALRGSVSPLKAGCLVEAEFEIFPIFKALRIISSVLLALLLAVVITVLILQIQFEGVVAVYLGGGILSMVFTYFILYITAGSRSQSKITTQFLDDLTDSIRTSA